MSFSGPVLVVVAHGTHRSGAVPGALVREKLQQLLPSFDVRLAFLHSNPGLQSVLPGCQTVVHQDIFLFPLFFSENAITVDELLAATRGWDVKRIQVLPAAGCLHGVAEMVANRAKAHIDSEANPGDRSAIFLVSHGRKNDAVPVRNLIGVKNAVAETLGHDDVYNVQLDGRPSLGRWREMTGLRKAMFIPLMAGEGNHCQVDIPTIVDAHPDERIKYLPPVGTWRELPELLVDYIYRADGGGNTDCDKMMSQQLSGV